MARTGPGSSWKPGIQLRPSGIQGVVYRRSWDWIRAVGCRTERSTGVLTAKPSGSSRGGVQSVTCVLYPGTCGVATSHVCGQPCPSHCPERTLWPWPLGRVGPGHSCCFRTTRGRYLSPLSFLGIQELVKPVMVVFLTTCRAWCSGDPAQKQLEHRGLREALTG